MAKEAGSPKLLFENLDLTPIHSILWTGLHTEGPGRPVIYRPEWDLRALMLRQLLQIPYVKDLAKRHSLHWRAPATDGTSGSRTASSKTAPRGG